MKKLFLLPLLCLATIPLMSCEEKEQPPVPPTNSTEIKINLTEDKVVISDTPGGEPTNFTIDSHEKWNITLSDQENAKATKATPNWVKVSPMSGEPGTVQVSVTTVKQNPTYDSLTAYLIIRAGETSKTIKINQAPRKAVIVTKAVFDVEREKDTIEVEVNATREFTQSISVNWIKEIPLSKALTTTHLRYAIAENETPESRIGQIVFKDKNSDIADTVIVNQTAHTPDGHANKDRENLMKIYDALGGDNWTNKTNWGTDKPLYEWNGISTNYEGRVNGILLPANNLKGQIPPEIGNLTNLESLELSGAEITGSIPSEIGKLTKLTSIYFGFNQLSGQLPPEIGNLTLLKSFNVMVNNIEGNIPESFSKLTNLTSFSLRDNRMSGQVATVITEMEQWKNTWVLSEILTQQTGYSLTANMYESTDYSKNKTYRLMQEHTLGDGVQLVMTGDAYSDRDITSGEYDKVAQKAMDAFFAIEPMKSLKPYFDVHCLYLVSKNDVAGFDTALGTHLRPGSFLIEPGDIDLAMDITRASIPSCENATEVHIIVLAKMESHAGINGEIPGKGSVSFIPTVSHDFNVNIQHEAAGHGYGRLKDEYIAAEGSPPQHEIDGMNMDYQTGGYNRNIDFTTDPNTVKWSKFLADPLYNAENLGIYEGAIFPTGIYRPSENSIMKHGTKFCAPSRQAIYIQVMKLAGVTEYDYDKFVIFDAPSRAEY